MLSVWAVLLVIYPYLGEGTPTLVGTVSVTRSYETVAIYSVSQVVFGSMATRSRHGECSLLLAPGRRAGVLWNLISNIVVARQEVGMPPRADNVIPLRPRNRPP